MMEFLTGRKKSERSSKEKSIKFPYKVEREGPTSSRDTFTREY